MNFFLRFRILLERAWEIAHQEWGESTPALRAALREFLKLLIQPWRWLMISRIYPPLPVLAEGALEFIGALMDWFTASILSIPPIVAANLIFEAVDIDPVLRRKVMTLDQAAILPLKVIVDYGIREIQNGPSNEITMLTFAQQRGKWKKWLDLIRFPTWSKYFKLRFGSWQIRLVKLAFTLILWVRVFGLVLFMWDYAKIISNPLNWPTVFSGALRQSTSRKIITGKRQQRINPLRA